MRILHVCKFFPPVEGGMETVVRELADGQATRGHDVRVLCADLGCTTVEERAPGGYPVTRVGSLGRWLGTSLAPGLASAFRRASAGVDIVHLHLPDPAAALAVRLGLPARRPRLVVHWHSDVVRQGGLAYALYRRLEQWLLARADAVIATSPPYAAASLPLKPWPAKVHVVPIGIGDNPPQAGARAVQAVRERHGGKRIVFSLGRMTAYKGFDVLIDAAARLPADAIVVAGGDGALLAAHRAEVARRGLEGRIVFPGRIDDLELPSYFAACSVFCLASTLRSEAFGVVLLEAMQMRRPIVATDIAGSGVPWVCAEGEAGLLVPPGDAAALAEGLMRVLGDAGLADRLAEAGARRYGQRFTASRMVDATEALYARLG